MNFKSIIILILCCSLFRFIVDIMPMSFHYPFGWIACGVTVLLTDLFRE